VSGVAFEPHGGTLKGAEFHTTASNLKNFRDNQHVIILILAGQDMLESQVFQAQCVVPSVLLALPATRQKRLVSDRLIAPCQDICWTAPSQN